VTYHYFVEAGVGGLPVYVQVVDDKLGFIGTNTEQAQEFVRTTTLTETTTNTASMTARDFCPCPGEPITDSVTVAVSPCTSANPLTSIVTIAKGQSPTNNPKLSHTITGYIVDAGSLGPTAHRIEVCAGTSITALVTDTSGRPTNTAAGSLACISTKCSGVVNVSEKYQSISQDGRDKDSITFIPK
jgi:hypothetical protein